MSMPTVVEASTPDLLEPNTSEVNSAPPRTNQNNANPVRVDPIAETIDAIVDMEQRADRNLNNHQRYVENGTALVGRPAVLYAITAASVLWIIGNLIAEGLHKAPIDAPPFAWLTGAASLCGLFVAMIVLITQNRQARLNERRAQLDLQVNLLNEQKLTKIIELIEELRRDLPNVANRHDPEAEAMTQGIDTQTLIEAIEVRLEAEELLNEIDAETAQ